MEHRWGQRMTTDIAVSIITMPATIGTGRMLNVSFTGAYIRGRTCAPLLSLVYLEPVDSNFTGFAVGRIAAALVRCLSDGFGLEWCDDSASAVERLMSTLRQTAGPTLLNKPVPGTEAKHIVAA
jgi:hypothetical protein